MEYDKELEQEFEEFWSTQGELIVLEKWKESYGDYMDSGNDADSKLQAETNIDADAPKNTMKSNEKGSQYSEDVSAEISDHGDVVKSTVNTENSENRAEILGTGNSGWGDIGSTTAAAASCKSTWGVASNVSNARWGEVTHALSDKNQPTSNNVAYKDNAIQAEDIQRIQDISPNNVKSNMTLTDEEQWNILWQEMWKATRLAQYNDFMNRRTNDKMKTSSKKLSTKSSEIDLNDTSKYEASVTPESNGCDFHLEKGVDQSGRQYMSSRTNAGVGMILEILKQESAGLEQERIVPTVVADDGIENNVEPNKNPLEYEDCEPPDEQPVIRHHVNDEISEYIRIEG